MRRLRHHLWIVLACLGFTGCGETYLPVPPQRTTRTYRAQQIFRIGPPGDPSGAVALSGVAQTVPGLDWTWASERSSYRLRLDQAHDWELQAKLTSADAVLSKTGPQHLRFLVNGVTVGTAVFDHAQTRELRFPVPPSLVTDPAETAVTMEAEPCVPQAAGPSFCVLLHEIGFSRLLKNEEISQVEKP